MLHPWLHMQDQPGHPVSWGEETEPGLESLMGAEFWSWEGPGNVLGLTQLGEGLGISMGHSWSHEHKVMYFNVQQEKTPPSQNGVPKHSAFLQIFPQEKGMFPLQVSPRRKEEGEERVKDP